MVAQGLGHEPGLAHSRPALDQHRSTGTLAERDEKGLELLELALAADERQRSRIRGRTGPRLGAYRQSLQGCRLALHVQRRQCGGPERRARALDHRLGGVDLARWCSGHQTSSDVHRVTHCGVGRAEGHAHGAREHMAAVHAHMQVQLGRDVGDAANGPQHATFVVLLRGGRSGGQDHLAPVLVEVGRQEGDHLRVAGILDAADQPVQLDGRGFGPTTIHQRFDPPEPHERHGRRPVLWLHGAFQQVGAQCYRHEVGDRLGRHRAGRDGTRRRSLRAAPAEPPARPIRLIGGAGRQGGPGGGAHDDLARPGRVLHPCGQAGRRSGDDELAVGPPDAVEVDLAAVDADGHAQRDAADRRRHGRRLLQCAAHLHRRVAGLDRMVHSAEHDEKGVAAELEQDASACVGQLEHAAEHAVQHLGELLGADPAPPGQALGQVGEAGDVDEAERGVQ